MGLSSYKCMIFISTFVVGGPAPKSYIRYRRWGVLAAGLFGAPIKTGLKGR